MWPFVSKPIRDLKSLVRSLNEDWNAVARIRIVESMSSLAQETAGKNAHIFRAAIRALSGAAKHSDRSVRLRAIQELKRLASGDESIYELISPFIQDRDPEVQNEVLNAIIEGHHYPSMLEALHFSSAEVKPEVAVRIASCFYKDITKLRNLDRWMKGQNSNNGTPPPSSKTREEMMYERFTLQETLKVYSMHFSNQLRRSRSMHLVRNVIVHLLNLWDNHPWDPAVESFAAEFFHETPEAIAAFQELLSGAPAESVLKEYGSVAAVNSPACLTCSKELEILRFAIRESVTSKSPTLVYSGIVCKECKKIQCSDCKGNPNLSPCLWCGAEVAPAYSKYL